MQDDVSLFGEVIYSYSRAQALEHGVLVDISTYAQRYFKHPVAVTSALWELLELETDKQFYTYDSTESNVYILLISLLSAIRKSGKTDLLFFSGKFYLGNGSVARTTLKAVCGPGDDSSPVITIMLENED